MPLKNRFFHANTEYNSYNKHVSAPLLRSSFEWESGKVKISVIGLGFYRLFLNGKDITRGELAPYIANPDHYVYVDEYDVTDKLIKGENVVGLILGNGMQNSDYVYWDFKDNVFRSAPKFAFTLDIDEKEIFDAENFVWTESPYYYDDLRSGVFYDATREIDGWCNAGFDDSGWLKVSACEHARGKIRIKESPDVTIYDEVKPLWVKPSDLDPVYIDNGQHDLGGPYPETAQDRTGGFLYDFGINTSALYRLCVKGKRGQKISLQFCEILDEQGRPTYSNLGFYPDGYVQRDIYICKGEGEEVFIPAFTYHGYRYCYVTGITEEQATESLLTMLKITTDMEPLGNFSCSSDIVNTLQKIVRNTDFSNIIHFPTDCPHREKHGWTGDATVSAEHMLLNYNIVPVWREWLYNIRAAQLESGAIPGIVPTDKWGYAWGSGPIWDNVLFELSYITYIYRGNDTLIRENATAMLRYLHYASSKKKPSGMLEYGLGDWAQVNTRPKEHDGISAPRAPGEFVDTAAIFDAAKKAEFMFGVIGMKKEAEYAKTFKEELLDVLRSKAIDHYTATAMGSCQTSQALAISLGIFNDSELYAAGKTLEEIIERDGGHIDCGLYGMRYLFHALSKTGRSELAFKLITQDSFPSYKWFIDEGMTALAEGFKQKNLSSRNHHAFGDVSHWFYRWLAGINVNPYGDDCSYVEIHPQFINELSFVEARCSLSSGDLSVRWERVDDDMISLKILADNRIALRFIAPTGYAVEDFEDRLFDGKRVIEKVTKDILLRKQ